MDETELEQASKTPGSGVTSTPPGSGSFSDILKRLMEQYGSGMISMLGPNPGGIFGGSSSKSGYTEQLLGQLLQQSMSKNKNFESQLTNQPMYQAKE